MTAVIRPRKVFFPYDGDHVGPGQAPDILRSNAMTRIPLRPKNPERICWGCHKYCPAEDLACGNGTIRAPHPVELFGEDWLEWMAGQSKEIDHEAG